MHPFYKKDFYLYDKPEWNTQGLPEVFGTPKQQFVHHIVFAISQMVCFLGE